METYSKGHNGALTKKCGDVLGFNNGVRDLQLDNGRPGAMMPSRQYGRLILEPWEDETDMVDQEYQV